MKKLERYKAKHSLLLKTFGLYRGSVSFINIYSGEPLQLKRYNSTIQSKLFSISYQPSLQNTYTKKKPMELSEVSDFHHQRLQRGNRAQDLSILSSTL